MNCDDIPCCAADAMRRVKPVEVNGASIGLAMPDPAFAEVRAPGLTDGTAVRTDLLKQEKIYDYVPAPSAEAYADAVHREYAKWNNQGGIE